MLTTDEARALAILTALVALGACLGWIDARHPRILALTLGDSLALGVPAGDPGAPGDPAPGGPAPAAVPPAEPGGASAAAPADSAAASPGDRGGAYTADGRLDLNRATAEELEGLPGVGPKTAERIVLDRRARGPFRSARDLGRVKGIGPKTLARLLPHVAVGRAASSRPEGPPGSPGTNARP